MKEINAQTYDQWKTSEPDYGDPPDPRDEYDDQERKGGSCPSCGELAVHRTCDCCGISAWIIDCEHYDQPRPICDSVCEECLP